MMADPYRRAAAVELDPAPAPSRIADEDDKDDPVAPVALPARRKRAFIADDYEIDARPRVAGMVFGALFAFTMIWIMLSCR